MWPSNNFTNSFFSVQYILPEHIQKRRRLVASCYSYRLIAIRQHVARNLLESGLLQLVICRLVIQLVETTCNKPVESKLWQSICSKPVDNLQLTCRQQSCRKSCERILISACWYDVCWKVSTALLQLAGFWLCSYGQLLTSLAGIQRSLLCTQCDRSIFVYYLFNFIQFELFTRTVSTNYIYILFKYILLSSCCFFYSVALLMLNVVNA